MVINSEEPHIHWGFLQPRNKVILDLGCTQFFLANKSTPEWFIEQGARYVFGVDGQREKFEHPRFTMDVKMIDSEEKLKHLIIATNPDIIKADIEGAEKYFKCMMFLPGVSEVAIEYHDPETKKIVEDCVKQWGFTNINTYQLFDLSIEEFGVIHAWV